MLSEHAYLRFILLSNVTNGTLALDFKYTKAVKNHFDVPTVLEKILYLYNVEDVESWHLNG